MNIFSAKTYTSIEDLPVYNWNKLISGELKYLYIRPRAVKRRDEVRLYDIWEEIYDTYFKKYGLNEAFIEYFNKRKKVAQMQLEVILKGDRKLLTHIDIAKDELKEEPTVKIEFMQTVVSLEKFFGFSIDIHRCSVDKYHSYIKQYNGQQG